MKITKWLCFDFLKNKTIRFSQYKLQASGIEDRLNPRYWEISGPNNKNFWIQFDNHIELDFDFLGIAKIFRIRSEDILYYKYIKILQTSENKNLFLGRHIK